MPPPITIDILDRMRPNLASLVMERAKRLPGMRLLSPNPPKDDCVLEEQRVLL